MFVPMILLITVVVPIWITLHYRSLNNSSRALSDDDRQSLDEMLEAVDRMTDRITNLEAILMLTIPTGGMRRKAIDEL